MNRLINSACFRVRSITRKPQILVENAEITVLKYRVKSTVHGTWNMENTSYCNLNNLYPKNRYMFSTLLFYKHKFLSLNLRGKIWWRRDTRKFFVDHFDLVMLKKLTYSLSYFPLYTSVCWNVYDVNILKK